MKSMRALSICAAVFFLAGCAAAVGEAPPDAEPVRPATEFVSAEEGGWELLFEDNFNRSELGDNWEVSDGTWSVEDGALVGSGTLISTRGFPDDSWGFTRLEFKVRTDVRPFQLLPGPPPEVSVSDLSSFIHSRPPEKSDTSPIRTGYFFQFGGFLNERNMIRRNGQAIAQQDDPEIRIITDQVHHIVVENDEGNIRMFVDEQLVLEAHDRTPFAAWQDYNRVGFYFYTRARMENVRVYIKRMDDRDLFL